MSESRNEAELREAEQIVLNLRHQAKKDCKHIFELEAELQRYKDALKIAEEALPSLDKLAVEEARAAMGPKGKINPTTKQRDLLRKLRAAIQTAKDKKGN